MKEQTHPNQWRRTAGEKEELQKAKRGSFAKDASDRALVITRAELGEIERRCRGGGEIPRETGGNHWNTVAETSLTFQNPQLRHVYPNDFVVAPSQRLATVRLLPPDPVTFP